MALDCDSLADMQAATNQLMRQDISYLIMESSPGRYWVIADRVGTFKELFPLFSVIRGVDRNYVRCASSYKEFHLRAYPKRGYIPQLRGRWVSSQCQFMNKFRCWTQAWLRYWESDYMREVASNIIFGVNSGRIRRQVGERIPAEVGELVLGTGTLNGWGTVNPVAPDTYSGGGIEPVEAVIEVPIVDSVVEEPEEPEEEPVLEITNNLDLIEL